MQPLDFLNTADHLRNGQAEADWRSSISRSYYAIYWLIGAEFLKTIPLLTLQTASLARKKDHLVHERLPQILQASTDPTIQEFGDELDKLRLARVKAAYNLAAAISKPKAETEFLNATDLKNDVQKFGVGNLAIAVKNHLDKIYGATPPPPPAAPPPPTAS